MAKRYFNWALAIVLVVAAVVLAVSAVALRGWQRKMRAERARPLAEEAYARGDWEEAARQFGRYVAIYGDDIERLLKYAEAQRNRRPLTAANVAHARAVYSSILRLPNGRDNREAAIALVELDLERSAFAEAETNAARFLENNDDPIVRRLHGTALRGLRRWSEAASVLADLIADHPDEVLAYEEIGTLAEVRPADVNRPADYWFDEAVRQNPESALAYVIRAGFRQRSSDPNGALADLKQAETLDLSQSRVCLRLIAALVNAGAREDAKRHLKALQARAPDAQGIYQVWAVIALTSGSADEMKTVAEEGLKALAIQPWDFMPVAAELLIQAGEDEKADECLARMREKGILPSAVAYLEGRAAERQGRLQDAVNSWRRAISLNYNDFLSRTYGSSPPVRMALARALEQLGEVPSAIEQMRALVSEALEFGMLAQEARGRLYLAQLLARTGNWAGVLDEARRVLQLDPGSTAAMLLDLQARITLLRAGDEPPGGAAWQEIERELLAAGQMPDAALGVGLLRVRAAAAQGQLAQAGTLLDELERSHPGRAEVAQLRAALYTAEADLDRRQGDGAQAAEKERQAVAVLRQAIEVSPQNTELVKHLAALLARQDEMQECESVIRDAIARVEGAPARRDLGLWLAGRYDAWGQDDKLLELLTSLARQDPSDILVKRGLLNLDSVATDPARAQKLVDEIKQAEGPDGWQWRLEQARVWMRPATFKTRYPEIVGLLQENLTANPGDVSSRLLLAAAYEQAGQTQPALAMYREVLNREPNNVQVIVSTVQALHRAGEAEEARRILAQADQRDLYDPDLRMRRLQLTEELRLSDVARDTEEQREALISASTILEEILAQDPNDTGASLNLALVLARQKKFEEAQAIINDLRAADPQALYVTAAQVQLYIEQGDAEKAVQLCDETVGTVKSAAAHVMRARAYAAFNQRQAALDGFTRAVELEPNRAAWWLLRADFHRQLGRRTEALADARKALALAPDNLGAQRLVAGLLLSSRGRSGFAEAERLLERALTARPQDVGLRLLQARLLLTKRTVPANEQARRVLIGLTESQPRLVEAWELLGRLELSEGQPGRAMDVAAQGLGQNPGDRDLLLLKADAEWQRSPAVAVLTLRTVVDQYPQDLDALIKLANAYVDSSQPDAALALLRGSLPSLEGAARRHAEIVLATIMYRNGDKAGAQALLDQLQQAQPDDPAPVLALAQLLATDQSWSQLKQRVADWCAQHPSDAQTPTIVARTLFSMAAEPARQVSEEVLRDALQRHPTSVEALHLLAMLTQSTGRGEESAQLNRRILKLDPNDVIAMNNLAWFLCEQRQYPEALQMANRGLMLAPEYSDLRDTRGVIYYRMGRYEDAVRDLEQCVSQYRDDVPALAAARFHLGRAHAALGRKKEAEDELTQSLDLHGRVGGLSPSDVAEAQRLLAQVRASE